MMGAAVAWFLADHPGFDGRVLVVERDPSYALSSTAHSNSCLRLQFTQAINVRVSQFGLDFLLLAWIYAHKWYRIYYMRCLRRRLEQYMARELPSAKYEAAKEARDSRIVGRFARRNVRGQNGFVMFDLSKLIKKANQAGERLRRKFRVGEPA